MQSLDELFCDEEARRLEQSEREIAAEMADPDHARKMAEKQAAREAEYERLKASGAIEVGYDDDKQGDEEDEDAHPLKMKG